MNLTRKLLDSLGITETDKQDAIIEAYTEKTDLLKTLQAQHDELQGEVERLKKAGTDYAAEKARADQAVKDLADYKAAAAASEQMRTIKSAYRDLARAARIDDKRLDTVVKAAELTGKLTGLKLNADGTLDGAEDLAEGIRTEWADFIVSESTAGSNPATPPAAAAADDDMAAVRAAMGLPPIGGK